MPSHHTREPSRLFAWLLLVHNEIGVKLCVCFLLQLLTVVAELEYLRNFESCNCLGYCCASVAYLQ